MKNLTAKLCSQSQWKGKDAFPSSLAWEQEIERWLVFLNLKGWLNDFWPRLITNNPKQRDETLAEVAAAYFLETRYDLKVSDKAPAGSGTHRGDFLLQVDGKKVFCEVKNPGWRREIVEDKGKGSQRLKGPKYIDGEVRCFDNTRSIQITINKATQQLPKNMANLVVLNDDLWVSVFDEPKHEGMPLSVYNALFNDSNGCFVSRSHSILSGIMFLAIDSPINDQGVRYQHCLVENPNADLKLPIFHVRVPERIHG